LFGLDTCLCEDIFETDFASDGCRNTYKPKAPDKMANEIKKPVIECGVSDLASALGVSERRVQQLVDEDVAVRTSRRGKYDMVTSVRNYIAAQSETPASADAKEKLELEKVRWTRARADREEANLALLRGNIVLIEDAAKLLAEEAGSLRAAWEGQESALVSDFSNRILTEAEVAIRLRKSRDEAFKLVTLDTAKPRAPRTTVIPSEFLPDDDTDIDVSVPESDEEERTG
jgi:hypothetical protein